jgi:hypothetical protein
MRGSTKHALLLVHGSSCLAAAAAHHDQHAPAQWPWERSCAVPHTHPHTTCVHACAFSSHAVVEVDGEPLDFIAMGMEPSLEEVLDEGVTRLKERPTWKLWTWRLDNNNNKEFTDAESFRQHITEKNIREELRKFLPRDDPKAPERPAEEGFRKRMWVQQQ